MPGVNTGISVGGSNAGQPWSSYWMTREPSNVAASITGSTTATVTWNDSAVTGASGYKVYAGATLKATVNTGVQTANLTGLTADTEYVFKVVAYKGSNESTGVSANGTTFTAAAQTFINKITVPPSNYRKSVINTTLKSILATGANLDVLQVYCGIDSQMSYLDWIGNTTPSPQSSPIHFPFYGIRGNGSSMYIDTGFDASLAINLKQNDACVGIMLKELGTVGAFSVFGAASGTTTTNINYLPNFTGGAKQIVELNVANYTSADDVAVTPAIGITTISRATSGSSSFFQNKTSTATNTKNSNGVPSGNMFVLAYNNKGTPAQYINSLVCAFWAGASINQTQHNAIVDALNYYYNNIFEPVEFTGNVCIFGDSLIAQYKPGAITYSAIAYLLRYTGTLNNLATPGETIAQQKTRYDGLAAGVKSALNYVFVQVGLNDLNPAEDAPTTLGRYQGLIDDINTNSASAKIVVGTMTPCKQRLIDIYGAVNGATAYQKWLDMNTAIMGSGANAITGVDARLNAHTTAANDGSGNLAATYDIGDHIHGNNDLRALIASSWNTAV